MNSLSCWQDDQYPVARNDFVLGKTVVLDEVHHRDEMSKQRSTVTAAWSSSSYVRNCAFPQTAYQRVAEKKDTVPNYQRPYIFQQRGCVKSTWDVSF